MKDIILKKLGFKDLGIKPTATGTETLLLFTTAFAVGMIFGFLIASLAKGNGAQVTILSNNKNNGSGNGSKNGNTQ